MKNYLKNFRTSNGYSLQELSDITGIAKDQLHALEQEDSNPTLMTCYKLSKLFNVSAESIWPNPVLVVEHTVTVRKISRNIES